MVHSKSQIVIEYAYRLREKAQNTSIFWIHASSKSRFEQAFSDIAAKLKLPGYNSPETDMLLLVYRWLDDEANGSWFIILDNADDSDILDRPHPSDTTAETKAARSNSSLMEFIPRKPHGKLLVTSRNRKAAYELVGGSEYLIKVDKMSPKESLSLLRSKVPLAYLDSCDARELLDHLDHVPLAITQAGAYVEQNSELMTISLYLDLFRQNTKNQTSLLNSNYKNLRRDSDVPNAVIATWEISFDQIRKQNSSSADLLSLMAMFDWQQIPDFLLRDGGKNQDEPAYLEAIGPLLSFSMIKIGLVKGLFDMHRLVRIANRKWLENNPPLHLQHWKSKALERVAQISPSGRYKALTSCRRSHCWYDGIRGKSVAPRVGPLQDRLVQLSKRIL